MLTQGQAGNQTVQDGAIGTIRLGRDGDQLSSEFRGRYAERTRRGSGFMVASQAVATTTVGLALAYTGLILSNPVGSGLACELNKASVMQSVIQAANVEAYALAVGFNPATNVTHTTPATPVSTLIGSGISSNMRADVSATMPTAPTYAMFVQNTATATQNGAGAVVDLEGSIILNPGGYIAWVTPAQASVAGLWFSFQWTEYAL